MENGLRTQHVVVKWTELKKLSLHCVYVHTYICNKKFKIFFQNVFFSQNVFLSKKFELHYMSLFVTIEQSWQTYDMCLLLLKALKGFIITAIEVYN